MRPAALQGGNAAGKKIKMNPSEPAEFPTADVAGPMPDSSFIDFGYVTRSSARLRCAD
jgi:hypothetical protein